jgi:hypothetical protein
MRFLSTVLVLLCATAHAEPPRSRARGHAMVAAGATFLVLASLASIMQLNGIATYGAHANDATGDAVFVGIDEALFTMPFIAVFGTAGLPLVIHGDKLANPPQVGIVPTVTGTQVSGARGTLTFHF